MGLDPTPRLTNLKCVPLRSEILTHRGFQAFDQVQVGDEIVAYDVANDVCVWTPLRAVTLHGQLSMSRLSNGQGFFVDCSPDQSWAVLGSTHRDGNRFRPRVLRAARDLRVSDSIVLSAPAPEGDHPLTPVEAAILGWLGTDGTVKRRNGRLYRAAIMQSKQVTVGVIRALVGGVATEVVGQPTVRTFPSGRTYACLPQHTFVLPAKITRALFAQAGIDDLSELPSLVTRLSSEARQAMLEAMMQGDGTARGVFGQKAKAGVMDAFQILATLEGIALGKMARSSVGDVPLQRLKKRRYLCASQLSLESIQPQAAWCPTTAFGTWIIRQDGRVMITGCTVAVLPMK